MIQEKLKSQLLKRRFPPVRVVKTVDRIRHRVSWINQRMVPSSIALIEMITAPWLTQAIYVAAKLELADLIQGRPMSVQDLAKATHTHAGALERVLRLLSSYGIFRKDESGKYHLTPMADCLRSDSKQSIRALALFQGGAHWNHWGHLLDAVKTGKSAVEHVHGTGFFDYLAENEETSILFDEAMNNLSEGVATALMTAYDFRNYEKIVDVGGGEGVLLSRILQDNPHMSGVLFDLPEIVERSGPTLEANEVDDRCEVVGGDFFRDIPQGGDIYLLKHIIHDWSDHKAHEILKHVRKAMKKESKLLIVETLVTDDGPPGFGNLLDLEMLVTTGGKERSEQEYRILLSDNHFKLTRVIPTITPVSIIEAEKT